MRQLAEEARRFEVALESERDARVAEVRTVTKTNSYRNQGYERGK